ncbi:hypothetical protein PRIPAC_76391 [Pristionchus pacificus]|uniref:Uncharacterized protein n=1 Tax=Pristionchus pacificus TaxID=54126 RepID=A0A454Y741_PRIPA|nr:hypothetical protein PRIPAC_76391 [Pristionchus pacificus]|eukprot:PDM64329.1 hypothetical protein PRIPAC_52585 [Pristionchus pacificus]
MESFYPVLLLILFWNAQAIDGSTPCNPALETGIPCSPCLGKNCKAHPAYLRPGTMGKEREREAYARP